MRLEQTIRNLTFGDIEISLAVIRLGVTRLKKTKFVYLLVVVCGKVEKAVVGFVCGGRLLMIELMVVLLTSFSRMVWF